MLDGVPLCDCSGGRAAGNQRVSNSSVTCPCVRIVGLSGAFRRVFDRKRRLYLWNLLGACLRNVWYPCV